jgi:hypothetical protein
MIPALENVKYDVFLILPSPILMVVLGGMTEECDDFYEANHGLLLGVFHIQVTCLRSSACPAIIDG